MESTTIQNGGLLQVVLMQPGTDTQENDKLKKKCAKRGDCPSCGTKLLKLTGSHLLALANKKKQTPLLNKNGKLMNTLCLKCHPLDVEEHEEPQFIVPKILIVEKRVDGDDHSAVSEITLDRRLQQIDGENAQMCIISLRNCDEYSKAMCSTKGSSTKSLRKTNPLDDHDVESLTESENDDDGANPKHGRSPQHRSFRSVNNSSFHNQVSLSSSARNRWGESLAGMDGDLSTGPRPLPPKRCPSGDGEKNHSLHQSLPSRVTTTTVCNTTYHSSPQQRSGSPNNVRSGPNDNRIPRIIIPNSPTKKSNFIPPWNPRNTNNGDTLNARKPVGEEKKEIFFNSCTMLCYKDDLNAFAASAKQNEHLHGESPEQNGISVREITLCGNDNNNHRPIPSFDVKTNISNVLKPCNLEEEKGSYQAKYVEGAKEIHVDLTSFARSSRRTSSPTKDVTPRTLKRQKALNMFVQMEQIFPPEHFTSVKPPKKVQRAISTEVVDSTPLSKEMKGHHPTVPGINEAESKDSSVQDKSLNIKQLLSAMANGDTPESRVAILRIMTEMMWAQDGNDSRNQFIQENGMEALTTILWTEISHPNVQVAVLQLLFALASGQCEYRGKTTPMLSSEGADVVIDSLLITMEQHAGNDEIQLLGCQVLCCLSSELSSASDVNDGTNSGACHAVLSAMEAHRDVIALQEWGIRALYNQCVYSNHAETNKHNILSSKLENILCSEDRDQVFGGDVLLRVLQTSAKDLPHYLLLLEWTCKLYKALSATKAIAEMLSPAADLLNSLLFVARFDEDNLELMEAILATVSNLLSIDHNKTCINATDTVALILDIVSHQKDNLHIVILGSSIVSKLAACVSLGKEPIIGVGKIESIVDIMLANATNVALQESCMHSLACLSLVSEMAKQQLCAQEILDALINLCERNADREDCSHSLIHESMCTMIASVYSNERLQEKALRCDTLNMLKRTMERYQYDAKLQEIAVVALMNLSTGVNVDFLLEHNIVESIVTAMERNSSSAVIQKDACSALWNVGVRTGNGMNRVLETKAITCVVAAIQNHLENVDVVEMACGCLWGLGNNCDAVKQQLLMVDGGLESVAWTLVIHSIYPSLQEKACGVLSTVSSSVCDSNVSAAAKCTSTVVDAIRSNHKILPVLQAGARFLRQIILHRSGYANEICEVLPVVISAMKEHKDDHAFQLDSCNLLWTLSEKSPQGKARILNLDGVSVLMSILDNKGGWKSVENAALGAFKELAMSSNK